MTAYTTIPDSDVDAESFATSALFTSLRDNPIAITEKAAGAPVLANGYVVQAMIAAGAVGQSELKVANADATFTSSSGLSVASVQEYSFKETFSFSATAVRDITESFTLSRSLSSTKKWFKSYTMTDTGTATMRYKYIQASPPYDFGDGEVGLFIYAIVDNATNAIVSCSVAPDPPWPVDLKSKFTKDGVSYAMVSAVEKERLEGRNFREALLNPAKRSKARALMADKTRYPVPITPAMKNEKMAENPHPFGEVPEGKTVIMLDPVSDIGYELAEMHAAGETVSDIFCEDYFIIDNAPSGRRGPPGVLVPSFRWR